MKISAKLLSIVLHPLLLPSWFILLIAMVIPHLLPDPSAEGQLKAFLMIFINTFVFPVVLILLMVQLKFLKDIYIRDVKDRFVPYLATGIFFAWAYMVADKALWHPFIQMVLLGSTIGVFLCFFINIFIKVSAHSVGMGGAVVVMLILASLSSVNLLIPVILTILGAGLVGTSRLLLKEHFAFEVWVGFLTGIFSQYLAYSFIL